MTTDSSAKEDDERFPAAEGFDCSSVHRHVAMCTVPSTKNYASQSRLARCDPQSPLSRVSIRLCISIVAANNSLHNFTKALSIYLTSNFRRLMCKTSMHKNV